MSTWFQGDTNHILNVLLWIAISSVFLYALFILNTKALLYGLRSLSMGHSRVELWLREADPKIIYYGDHAVANYLTTTCNEEDYRFITVTRYSHTSAGTQVVIVAIKKSSTLVIPEFNDENIKKDSLAHIFIVNSILRPTLGGKYLDYLDSYPCHLDLIFKDDICLSIMDGKVLQEQEHYRLHPGF